MLKRITHSVFTILLSAYVISAQIDPPKLTPVPSTDNQARLIKEGVVLHDHQDYDGAIRKYEEVLKENPDNIEALFELGFSYSAKEDHKKSLQVAYRGSRYKSRLLSAFYMNAANSLDVLGDPKKAIELYKSGIKLTPTARLIHFNLAITYIKIEKLVEARASLKRSVVLDPTHASSHRTLGELFYKGGYKTPALLAMSRFLVLEPNSERSVQAYRLFQELLQGGVTVGDDPKKININVDFSQKKDEGDFGAIDMAMGLAKASDSLDEKKGKTRAQLAVDQLNTFFSIMSELDEKENKSKFVFKYYVPYFSELRQRDYVEPFYYYISRSGDDKDVQT